MGAVRSLTAVRITRPGADGSSARLPSCLWEGGALFRPAKPGAQADAPVRSSAAFADPARSGPSVVEQLAWGSLGAEAELVLRFGGQEVGRRVPRRLAQGRPAVVFGLGDEFAGEEVVEDA